MSPSERLQGSRLLAGYRTVRSHISFCTRISAQMSVEVYAFTRYMYKHRDIRAGPCTHKPTCAEKSNFYAEGSGDPGAQRQLVAACTTSLGGAALQRGEDTTQGGKSCCLDTAMRVCLPCAIYVETRAVSKTCIHTMPMLRCLRGYARSGTYNSVKAVGI